MRSSRNAPRPVYRRRFVAQRRRRGCRILSGREDLRSADGQVPSVDQAVDGRMGKEGGDRGTGRPFVSLESSRGNENGGNRTRRNGFWSAPRCWPGETVVCVASGPSLTREDIEYCRGKARVIVVNRCWELARWADALYAADAAWWRLNPAALGFGGLKVTVQPTEFGEIKVLKPQELPGLSAEPSTVHTGGNSGYQATNLAVLMGARRVLWLGYDMQASEGRKHWHPDHPWGLNNPDQAAFDRWVAAFEALAPYAADAGVEIVNCSRETAIKGFPRMPIQEALAL